MVYSKVKRIRYYKDMLEDEGNLGIFKVIGIKRNGKNKVNEFVYLSKEDELKGKNYSDTIYVDDFRIWRKDDYVNGKIKRISRIEYELS